MSFRSASGVRLRLGTAPSRLQQRVKLGERALLATVGLSAAPALLGFLASAISCRGASERPPGRRGSGGSDGRSSRLRRGSGPRGDRRALAGITVAIIFYNARAELPRGDAGEISDEEAEHTSTILRTKMVLRLVATLLAVSCWTLLMAILIQSASGSLTVFVVVEGIALATLIILSCNFITAQREEIAQRSLLALDAAVSAYDDAQKRRAARSTDRLARSLRRRGLGLTAIGLLWLGLALGLAREPATMDAVIILFVVGGVPVVLHWAVLNLAGALRVPWRRTIRFLGLMCTVPLLLAAYVSVVGLIVAPFGTAPDPRDRVFFASTFVLYVLTAITLWPVSEIAASKQARTLRDYITSRDSVVQRYLHDQETFGSDGSKRLR